MDLGILRATIVDRDSNQRIFWICLGILHKDVEVSIVIENTRVEKFVLKLLPRTPPIGFHQIAIGIFTLRVFVQVLHVRVRRSAIDIEVIFFDVFAVVGLTVRQAKHAFFQDRVATIPQGYCKAKQLLIVAVSA